MQSQKKLTLQQYIECHNIKKQLRERSKEKSRSKSRDRTTSLSTIPLPDVHNTTLLSPNRVSESHKISSHEILNSSIYDQVDFRARNLYDELQQGINEIKLECRAIIRNDKDFAFFLKLMDTLTNKFRAAVMHIHRENILLFQISKEADKTYVSERDDLARTHIQNLEKSFNEQYELSKSQYEANLSFVPHKTIKEKMQQNKKGADMVKAIFGGGTSSESKSHPMMLKKYDSEAKDENERRQRKEQAVSFLGFIMKNIAESKKNEPTSMPELPSPVKHENPQSVPIISLHSISSTKSLPPYTSQASKESPLKNQTPVKPTEISLANKRMENDQKLDQIPKKEDDKIVKNINYLNSRPKISLNTQNINKIYSEQNTLSPVLKSPSIKPLQKPIISTPFPKSPVKQVSRLSKDNKDSKIQEPRQKVSSKMSKKQSENEEKKDTKTLNEKVINRKRTIQSKVSASPTSGNRVQLIQRTNNSKSKSKMLNKVSSIKKMN